MSNANDPTRPDSAPPKRLRVVIDSDTANEIDDQFAIAWALRSPDVLEIEGVHAAPFSHGRYFEALAAASARRGGPTSDFDRIACSLSPSSLGALLERTPPTLGMERSYSEILRVFEASGVDPRGRIRRGAETFLSAPDRPVESEACEALIRLAHSATPEDPIHVATIGAPTNVASSILLDPSIASKLCVVFLAGYPSGAALDDDSFNLVQDRWATNVLLTSEVPLVYIPGYYVAETLQLSLPAAREWLSGGGRLARYLLETYQDNPINPNLATPGRSWVLWDIIAIAWLLNRDWVPTREVARARVDDAHRWEMLDSRGTRQRPEGPATRSMSEAHHVKRNEVLEALMACVTRDAS